MPWVRIREYESTDHTAVADLLGEMGYPVPEDLAGTLATAFIARGGTSLLVAVRDERIVGLVATCLVPRLDETRLSCRVTDLVVSSPHRRQGVGRALIQAAEASALAAGATRLDLTTGDWRAEAHEFYGALGFEDNGRALRRPL